MAIREMRERVSQLVSCAGGGREGENQLIRVRVVAVKLAGEGQVGWERVMISQLVTEPAGEGEHEW